MAAAGQTVRVSVYPSLSIEGRQLIGVKRSTYSLHTRNHRRNLSGYFFTPLFSLFLLCFSLCSSLLHSKYQNRLFRLSMKSVSEYMRNFSSLNFTAFSLFYHDHSLANSKVEQSIMKLDATGETAALRILADLEQL